MAKKSSTKVKKKGPKGKRARAKAKLERQWGEEAVETKTEMRGKQHNRTARTESTSVDDPRTSDTSKEHFYENYENPIFPQHSDDDDQYDEQVDSNAVSSFVEQLRQKHQKHKRKSFPQISQDTEKDNTVSMEDDSSGEDDEKQNFERVDPFSARFVQDSFAYSNKQAKSGKVAANQVRKIPLPFVREGTVLQLSQWPPLDDDALSAVLPHDRKDWRTLARRLWQAQKPLLREEPPPKTPLSQVIYPLLATYMDIFQTIPDASLDRFYASHILNHIWTCRQRIYQHSKELKQLEDDDDDNVEAKQDPKFRDQGFTRPTVLVLLPTRGICYQFVQTLLQILCGDDDDARATSLGSRFVTEYGPPQDVDTDPRRQAVLQQKGKEWNSLFGDDVNDDDDFKLGVTLHLHEKKRRPTMKLYTDFAKSDLILASPLGLKMWAAKGNAEDDGDDMEDEVESTVPDFLSSIEICWVSNAHILMMQNWDHVVDVLSWLNQRPMETADTDFSRIRPYFLEEHVSSAGWRQMVLTAKHMEPELKAAFGRFAQSRAGTARFTRKTSWPDAALNQVLVPTRQVFQRIVAPSVQEQADARLEYFGKNVLPKIDRDQQPFTLIFVPSYLEFVSLRNYLLKREADYFVSVTEYARHTEVSRGRARFGQGRKSLMLYTGRAHFFHRHVIRGVRHVIWYGLPSDPAVYHQVVDWCQDETTQTQHSQVVPESSVLALYTAYEAHALERIVGHAHCSKMTKGSKTTFLFAA